MNLNKIRRIIKRITYTSGVVAIVVFCVALVVLKNVFAQQLRPDDFQTFWGISVILGLVYKVSAILAVAGFTTLFLDWIIAKTQCDKNK